MVSCVCPYDDPSEIDPANQEVKTYYAKVQQLDKAHKQRQASALANMFG
jgi:hypothetical protein